LKHLKLIATIFLIFFLVGCQTETGKKDVQTNFKQGITELQLKVLEGAPPDTLYPNSEFIMAVELDNQAAYDVMDGTVTIVGLDEKYFHVNPLEQDLEVLEGRSLVNPGGTKTYLEFDGFSGELFQNAEYYTGNFFFEVSYTSGMEFVDSVCINPNLYGVYDSGCKVEERKSYSGQGSPLAVTEVEEIIHPGSSPGVEFRVFLETKGKGKVQFINFNTARLGGEPLICEFYGQKEGSKRIELTDDEQEAVLVCNQKFVESSGSYTTTLALDFTYDYKLKVHHKLKLENPSAKKRVRGWS